MAEILVQQWGDEIAIIFPRGVAKDAGLSAGERLDVSIRQGDVLLRRVPVDHRSDALQAAMDMIAESKNYTLGTSIRSLLDEGRRD